MKMTNSQKHNLLEFLNRTHLSGKEAITLVNLMYAVGSAEIIEDTTDKDGELTDVKK